MPYSKTPTYSTYSTERIAFFDSIDNRFPTATGNNTYLMDFSIKNLMLDEVQKAKGIGNSRFYLRPRPAAIYAATFSPTLGVGGRGIYMLNSPSGPFVYSLSFVAVGNRVYRDGNSTAVLNLATSTGHVGFASYISSTGVNTLVCVDGTNGYVSTDLGLTWTQITDVDFPTPHVPNPIFLDGYLFLAKDQTQDIYNSALDNPLSWASGDYISAEMYGDYLVGLARNGPYIYAIGQQSVEFFYDAANTSGSPLQRYSAAIVQIGGQSASATIQTDSDVYFVGSAGDGDFSLWKIDGFKAEDVGSDMVRRLLSGELLYASGEIILSVCRLSGRKLIIMSLGQQNRTLVYDTKANWWSEWTYGVSTSSQQKFLGSYFAGSNSSRVFTIGKTNNILYAMASATSGNINDIMLDNLSYPIICQITTLKYDFGTINRKTMSRLSVIGDPFGTLQVSSPNQCTVEWTDDDYTTWSAARTLDFSKFLPSINQLGGFRRRAFRFKFYSNKFFRLEGIEVDINKGSA